MSSAGLSECVGTLVDGDFASWKYRPCVPQELEVHIDCILVHIIVCYVLTITSCVKCVLYYTQLNIAFVRSHST